MLTTLFAAAVCLFQTPLPQAAPLHQPRSSPPIVINGDFDDWDAVNPALVDPADAPDAAVDLGEIRISHNDRFIHLLIDFGRNVNAQGMKGTAMLLLDVDGNEKTGRTEYGLDGTDIIIDLSLPQTKSPAAATGSGIGLRSTPTESTTPTASEAPTKPATLNPYDIGLMFAPTHSARRFEFRITRASILPHTPALFMGEHFAGKVVFLDQQKQIADETDPFTYELSPTAPQPPSTDDSRDPLSRAPGTDLRVMSWNIERGAIFTNPEPFRRAFAAIQPDVILLQELKDSNTLEQARDFLHAAIPLPENAQWKITIGSAGGDLHCGILTRLPLGTSAPLDGITLPNQPTRTIRAIGNVINFREKQILFVSVHLKCCGNAEGPEDQQRQTEAHAIHDAITAFVKTNPMDGVVIAGDFNLVGSRDPLEILAMGLDLDHSNLTIAPTLQLDGLSNTTWSDSKQPFTPGRLDYLLFADSKLNLLHSFVYDSRCLSPHWLANHHLEAADTCAASDHMPLVADISLTPIQADSPARN